MFRRMHEANGTGFRLDARIAAIEGTEKAAAVLLEGGERLPADLVVLGVGVTPATGFVDGVRKARGRRHHGGRVIACRQWLVCRRRQRLFPICRRASAHRALAGGAATRLRRRGKYCRHQPPTMTACHSSGPITSVTISNIWAMPTTGIASTSRAISMRNGSSRYKSAASMSPASLRANASARRHADRADARDAAGQRGARADPAVTRETPAQEPVDKARGVTFHKAITRTSG